MQRQRVLNVLKVLMAVVAGCFIVLGTALIASVSKSQKVYADSGDPLFRIEVRSQLSDDVNIHTSEATLIDENLFECVVPYTTDSISVYVLDVAEGYTVQQSKAVAGSGVAGPWGFRQYSTPWKETIRVYENGNDTPVAEYDLSVWRGAEVAVVPGAISLNVTADKVNVPVFESGEQEVIEFKFYLDPQNEEGQEDKQFDGFALTIGYDKDAFEYDSSNVPSVLDVPLENTDGKKPDGTKFVSFTSFSLTGVALHEATLIYVLRLRVKPTATL